MSQVERGVRSADRLSVLVNIAAVLRVDVEALTGRVWRSAGRNTGTADVGPVEGYLARYDPLFGDGGAAAGVSPADLAVRASRAHEMYQAAEYNWLVSELPSLLRAADSMLLGDRPWERRSAVTSYLSSYLVAAKLLTKMGADGPALLAADRCASATAEVGSAQAKGTAAYQLACAMLAGGRREDAEHLAVAAAESLAPRVRAEDRVLVSVVGSLWLLAAIIAARRVDRMQASARLALAQRLADVLGSDENFAWTAFGPTNVAVHRVSVAAELGDAAAALEAAAAVDLALLPVGLTSRRAQVLLDLAWAQAQRKRDAEAVLNLLEAERVAPEAVRYNIAVRQIVRELLSRARGPNSRAVHELAVRSGVVA